MLSRRKIIILNFVVRCLERDIAMTDVTFSFHFQKDFSFFCPALFLLCVLKEFF